MCDAIETVSYIWSMDTAQKVRVKFSKKQDSILPHFQPFQTLHFIMFGVLVYFKDKILMVKRFNRREKSLVLPFPSESAQVCSKLREQKYLMIYTDDF